LDCEAAGIGQMQAEARHPIAQAVQRWTFRLAADRLPRGWP
jgi:hypothetical protein